ncbi:hypothetical protein PLICRDRAFT_51724 [Plicaturopsis crispa FD-325 SS-3]|nr:hypothetical protein PLICRDRAFT_51724 [Plicaturopsis crispa FD-325 SS-3]
MGNLVSLKTSARRVDDLSPHSAGHPNVPERFSLCPPLSDRRCDARYKVGHPLRSFLTHTHSSSRRCVSVSFTPPLVLGSPFISSYAAMSSKITLNVFAPHCVPARINIQALPIDVLYRIFLLATFDAEPVEALDAPITISHVSPDWRAIALAAPLLWKTIVATWDMPETYPLVHMFLARSQQVPLDVCLDLRPLSESKRSWDDKPEVDAAPAALVDSLIPYAHRFQSFELLSDVWPIIHYAMQRFRDLPMPLLEKWSTRRCNVHHSWQDEFRPRELRNPDEMFCPETQALRPRLQDLVFFGSHTLWARMATIGLTSLTISYLTKDVRPSFEELGQILCRNAATLSYLDILGAAPIRVNDDPSVRFSAAVISSIKLPALNTLTVGYLDVSELKPLLVAICAPALKTLTLNDLGMTRITAEAYNLEPSVHHDLTHVLTAVIADVGLHNRTLPLHTLEHLKLVNVGFRTYGGNIPALQFLLGISHLTVHPRILGPLLMLNALPSLKSLSLHSPDNAILDALNVYNARRQPEGMPGSRMLFCASHKPLERLDISSAYPENISLFLRRRSALSQYVTVEAWDSLTVTCRGGASELEAAARAEGWPLAHMASSYSFCDEDIPDDVSDDSSDDMLDDNGDLDMHAVDDYIEAWGDPLDDL